MPDQTPKAGEYEQLVDLFEEVTSKKGEPLETITYRKGDIVTLTAEQAERLAVGERPSFAKPGERQRQEAAALKARADQLQAQADAAAQRAKDVAAVKTPASTTAGK